jgi:CBS-domain-containing membrane protein
MKPPTQAARRRSRCRTSAGYGIMGMSTFPSERNPMGQPRVLQLMPFKGASLAAPGGDPWLVDRMDPAQTVMTDFHERSAVSVAVQTPIDEALEHMKHNGVRSAFVVDDAGRHVVGMVTAYDIQGEKPIRHLQEIGGTHRTSSRSEVRVGDIMTPVDRWHVADMKDVVQATIGMVVDVFKSQGGTHVAVVESSETQGVRLRGVFSAARIMRLLRD